MTDALAYFITWTTYGTWLPGDKRGWVKRGAWEVQPPAPVREQQAKERMTGEVVVLTAEQRRIVHGVVIEHCRVRGWYPHACNVRTNHAHVVVSAPVEPDVVREQLKAWASRRLSEAAGLKRSGKNGRQRWWTEKGDIEWVYNDVELADVCHYVLELQ